MMPQNADPPTDTPVVTLSHESVLVPVHEASLLAAGRWSLWRTLARGLAHSLANAAQMLALEPTPPGARAEARERIEGAFGRLAAAARDEPRAPVALAEVLAELDACQALQVGFPSLRLERELGTDLPLLAMPREDLLFALLALVTNAREASPERPPRVLVRARRSGGGIELRVEDDGAGPAESVRRHPFAPFVHARDGAHLGLGLWAVRRLAERAGGEARLEASGPVVIRVPAWTAARKKPAGLRRSAGSAA